jgi:hypothetical protein
MRRLVRWRVIVPTVVLLVAAAIIGVKVYTRSDAAARLVSDKLQARLGTVAKFNNLSVGISSTNVSDLHIYEHGAGPNAEPFLAARDVELNVGAIGAASGKEPSEIHFRDVQLLLRFNRTGDLLTKLPKTAGEGGLPKIHIESGTLTIRQEGRDDSVFTGIDLSIGEIDQQVKINGTVEDNAWGKWQAEGAFSTGAATTPGQLTLKTLKPQAVTPELLRHVPFVNPSAWTHVGLAGTTVAKLELAFDAATDKVGYRVLLEPTDTVVDVPSIGLHFTNARGNVRAEAGVVVLTDVRGKSADGDIRLDSRMDFSTTTDVLKFTADLSNVDVGELPKQWRLPEGLDGRLTGKIDFTVTLPPQGGTRVEAAGKATIAQARLGGRPVPDITLDVGAGPGGGIDFSERPRGEGRHVVGKPDDPKVDEPRPDPKVVPGRRPGLVSGALKLAARIVKPANAPKEEKAYLHLNVAFRDVDLTELLKTANVEVPVAVGGKVTVQVQVDIPTETPDEFKAYRLTGTVRSRRVVVDELAIEDVAAQVDFRDGRLTVKDFVGRLPAFAANAEGGAFKASGEMNVGKGYPFKASVQLDRVPLESVEQLRNLLPVSLQLAGQANAQAKLEGTLSPLNLKTSGEAKVKQFKVGPIPADDFAFRWESDDQVIRFKDATAKLFGGEVSGSFEFPLRDDAAATGSLKLDNLDLGELSKSVMEGGTIKMEGRATGTVKLRSPAAGEGKRGATAEVDLQAPSMKLQGLPAKKIKGVANYASGVLNYTLTGEALGGTFEVAGQYPPAGKKDPAKPAEKKEPPKKDAGLDLGRIKLRGMQLSKLWDLVGLKTALGSLDADISGDFPLTTDDEGRLIGTGRLRADRLRFGGKDVASTGQAIVRLTSGEMTFEEITIFVGEGVARARATFNRANPDRSSLTMSLTNVPASRLLFLLPDMSGRFDMPVDGRLATTMGREWRGSGVLTSARGKIFGIPVSDVRLPLDWVAIPDRGRSEVRMRDATATAAGGQVTSSLTVNFFNDLPPKLGGDIQFRNVNLSSAFREAGKVIGNLPISGKLDFAADQYRGPDSLTANLRAKLSESQPLALPVLSALIPYLGYGRDSSTTIREGEIRAALGNGIWRVQQVDLSGSSLDLHAEGTITTAGNLNLNVVASSRSRPGQSILQRITPLGVVAAATPVQPLGRAALADLAASVGSYMIYMQVGGTIESPSVTVNPLRTLTEGAARFFLLRFFTPVPLP